jgi:hypothetical protein
MGRHRAGRLALSTPTQRELRAVYQSLIGEPNGQGCLSVDQVVSGNEPEAAFSLRCAFCCLHPDQVLLVRQGLESDQSETTLACCAAHRECSKPSC